jgi:hypothetical protein
VFYDVGLSLVKISILLLYRSIFRGRTLLITSNILIGVVIAWCLSNLLPSIFSCRPISGFWNFDMIPPPICIDKKILYITGSSINIATDVAILCLPIREVMRLQMHRQTKLALVAVFLLGGIVCIVSAVRFNVLMKANSPDLTWEFAGVLAWTNAELATAIASACLPVSRPLFRRCLPKSWISSNDRSGQNPESGYGRSGASGPSTGNKNFSVPRSYRTSHLTSNFQRLPDAYTATNDSNSDKDGLVYHGTDAIDMDNLQPRQILVTHTFETKSTTTAGHQGRREDGRVLERTRV